MSESKRVMIKKNIKNVIPIGIIRIKTKDFRAYEKTRRSWKLSKREFPGLINAVKLFRIHGNFKELIDKKNPEFLKGQMFRRKVQGARINVLPDGSKLSQAYSLFAKDLTIHDEKSNSHWDLIYRNPNGKYAYLYTLEKKKNAIKNKYEAVEEFGKVYKNLCNNVLNALKDKKDNLALPMYTLLKTYMRVGDEIYYKEHGHKGLTTLKKKDVFIESNNVKFNFIAKNGVPMVISERFPLVYIRRLRAVMKKLKNSDFIFTDNGKLLKDTRFMHAFERYCGKRFYPHIVRSYYATEKAKEFLKSHKSATDKEIREFFMQIAEKLGHKKFSKKDNLWKDNYNMTIHYYLKPEIFGRINSLRN